MSEVSFARLSSSSGAQPLNPLDGGPSELAASPVRAGGPQPSRDALRRRAESQPAPAALTITMERPMSPPNLIKFTGKTSGDLVRLQGVIEDSRRELNSSKTHVRACNRLLNIGEQIKAAGAKLLEESRGLPPDGLRREADLSSRFLNLPLAKLPVAQRAQIMELRRLYHSCLETLERQADKLEAAPLKKCFADKALNLQIGLNNLMGKLVERQPLDKYERLVTLLTRTIRPGERVPPTGDDRIRAIGLPNKMLGPLCALVNNVSSLRRDIELYGQLGRGEGLDKRAMVENLLQSFDLVNHKTSGINKFVSETLQEETLPFARPPAASPPAPDRAKQLIRDSLKSMSLTEKPESGQNAIRDICWNFERTLRFDLKLRLSFGLVGGASGQNAAALLREFVDKQPLGWLAKRRLNAQLRDILKSRALDPSVLDQVTPLGSGGLGSVSSGAWRGREVVVKSLHAAGAEEQNALLFEALMLDAFQSNPNLPQCVGLLNHGGRFHLAMEAIPGQDLSKYIRTDYQRGGQEERGVRDAAFTGLASVERGRVAAHLAGGIIRGLDSLHAHGLGFWDLKPENVILDKNSLEARLIDFGSVNRPGMDNFTDTPLYRDRGGPALSSFLSADIFSLGLVMYDLVTGDAAGRDNSKTLNPGELPVSFTGDIWRDPPMAQLKDLIALCLNANPMDRPTMEQLRRVMDGQSPPQAGPEEFGLKSQDEIAALAAVFGPGSDLAGGREIIADRLKNQARIDAPAAAFGPGSDLAGGRGIIADRPPG